VNVVDVVVIALVAAFAFAGLRQGFVVSVFSFLGFVVGGLFGLVLMPVALRGHDPSPTRSLLALGGVVILALAGQSLAGFLAARLRGRYVRGPVARADAVGGAVVGACAVLVAAWLVGSVLVSDGAGLPLADVARQSRILAAVDDVMPGTPDQVFSAFGNLLDTTGFPEVFSDATQEQVRAVPPPDGTVASLPAVRTASLSVVKVVGDAPSCQRRIEGSGFVYAPHRVMTNAHVVAGVENPVVFVAGSSRAYAARVVVFDADVDVAVLAVPDLDLPSLDFGGPVPAGTDAAVVGYPGDGPRTPTAARIRDRLQAIGQDVYGEGRVLREIYSLRVEVHPGSSGGPVLARDGRVIGVVFAASREDPETGYALTAKQVSAAAASGVQSSGDRSTSRCA
jgi:S1-C subfamily serine protease